MDLNDFTKLMNKGSQNKTKEPCDTCTDFSDWLRQNLEKKPTTDSNTKSSSSSSSTSSTKIDSDQMILAEQAYVAECPLQRDQFGRYAWGYLHTMAAYYPSNPTDEQKTDMKSFIRTFAEFFPCQECKDDFKKEIKKSPPRVNSGWDLSQWFCEQHNLVNNNLGKEEFDCSKVFERWKLGESKSPRC